VAWLCEEMGLAQTFVPLSFPPDRSYRALNPFGTVPFLQDGNASMSESVAMMFYIAQNMGQPTPYHRWVTSASPRFFNSPCSGKPQSKMHTNGTLRIRIVGGSLGGLFAAALLRMDGHQVRIYETVSNWACRPRRRCPYRKLKTADRDRESADTRSR
jgi:Glutathione S-transferase, N-terminal domain